MGIVLVLGTSALVIKRADSGNEELHSSEEELIPQADSSSDSLANSDLSSAVSIKSDTGASFGKTAGSFDMLKEFPPESISSNLSPLSLVNVDSSESENSSEMIKSRVSSSSNEQPPIPSVIDNLQAFKPRLPKTNQIVLYHGGDDSEIGMASSVHSDGSNNSVSTLTEPEEQLPTTNRLYNAKMVQEHAKLVQEKAKIVHEASKKIASGIGQSASRLGSSIKTQIVLAQERAAAAKSAAAATKSAAAASQSAAIAEITWNPDEDDIE